MDSLLYQKLNKISDLEDRALLKKIMQSVFSSLEDYTIAKYNLIENKVFDEINIERERYDIFSTICSRDKVDPISECLFPMIEEDMEEEKYEVANIRKAIMYNEEIFLFKIFMKCDYLEIKKFINNTKEIKGTIITDYKIHEAYFRVEENTEYKNKVKELYGSFINNDIPWKTKNLPYISKILNVNLVRCSDEIGEREVIEKIEVDFGDYAEFIEYNMVPLWNIKEISVKSSGFAQPCIDKVNYQHIIPIEKEGIDNGYIVKLSENENCKVIFKMNSLLILTPNKEKSLWNLYKFCKMKNEELEHYNYKILGNDINVNFAGKIAYKNAYAIRTKAELQRVISSFKVSEYLNLVDIKVESINEEKECETYELNEFIIDEIREDDIKKTLTLYFKAVDNEFFLNRDILSFLVSEVQLLYPEYKCEGRLI